MDRAPLPQALSWFIREVLRLPTLLNTVTVKRRRNAARPVRRRRSAFRDPMMCLDFLAMAWAGATRLSHIARHLAPRDDLARVFGLPRFADHTTTHNFLNAFHVTHLRQLDRVNDQLLHRQGLGAKERPACLDLDLARRPVRKRAGGIRTTYLWATAFADRLCVAQRLDEDLDNPVATLLDVLARARAIWRKRPRLIRLTAPCVAEPLLRALLRQKMNFLATTTWAWALARTHSPVEGVSWQVLGPETRTRDLGLVTVGPAGRPNARIVLVEEPSIVPGAPPDRFALVTSLLDADLATLEVLANRATTLRAFFGHPTWPLRDGKPPSSRHRGMAAYLRLATIAMNVLVLFARELGPPWTPGSVHRALRVVPWPSDFARAIASP